MNTTTIGSIPTSNWKRIKGQYVAVAAGVVLAVGAVVTLAPMGSSSQPVQPSRQAAIQTLSPRPAVSTSEAAIAASVLSTEMAHYGAPVEVVRKSFEADVLASARSGEAAVFGAEPAVAEQRKVSEADILASALSGEAATYHSAEPAQAAVAPNALEAAIAASVLSTELAAWAQ